MSLFIAKDQTRGNTRIEWHCIQRVGKLIASPPLLKCSWTGGVVDFKDGLPGADSIFFNTVTTHQAFF